MDNQNGNKDNNKNNKQGFSFVILITMLTALLVFAMYQFQGVDSDQEITYNKFLKMIDEKKVEKVEIKSDRILITAKKESGDKVNKEYYTGRMNDDQLVEKLEKAKIDFNQEVPDTTSAIVAQYAMNIIPLVIFIALIVWMTRKMSKGGGMMGIGKSNAKMYVEKQTGVTFKDVAGQDEAKESLQEVVDFLHNPGKYTSVGAKLPKGALLVGPPGTGKTLLAKAVAGEAKVPFFSLSGSAFVEMYVGVGASRVRDLFKQAQQMAPCIIFIDEIDAIGKSRDTQMVGNYEREQTLNQILAEMDGFESNKGLVLLAATNRPEILDPALLRQGRFDRRIIVERPDLKGRVEVLKVHSKDVKMDETVDLEAIALATSGAVGSDLANMINEAAINAVKNGRNAVSQADLFEAVEVVLVGKEKKDRVDDAVCATRAALEEGILPGGGVSLVRAQKDLIKELNNIVITDDENVGYEIVLKSLSAPMKKIAENAGKSGEVIVEKVLDNDDYSWGYDAKCDKFCNLVDAGILDATKVVRCALENGSSIAGSLLTVEGLIIDDTETNLKLMSAIRQNTPNM